LAIVEKTVCDERVYFMSFSNTLIYSILSVVSLAQSERADKHIGSLIAVELILKR